MALKYKVGDKVRIKNIVWYFENKGKRGFICFDHANFIPEMSRYCGEILTITKVVEEFEHYLVSECAFSWTDEMIECKVEVEEEKKPKFKIGDKVMLGPYPCKITDAQWKDDYGFVYTVRGTDFGKTVREYELVFDERKLPNNSEIIRLIKNDWKNFKDRYDIPDDYHFVDKNGNEINIYEIVLEKKKKEYPKTYEECCKVLGCKANHFFTDFSYNGLDIEISDYENKIDDLLQTFRKLRYCRDAYWKIAGEENGLGKPWEPDYTDPDQDRYAIANFMGNIEKSRWDYGYSITFVFPTEEMRDQFYENFKEDIEKCKELL